MPTPETTKQPQVRPGQVWADNDPRYGHRRLLVLRLEVRDHWKRPVENPAPDASPTHARVTSIGWRNGEWAQMGPETSLKLASMHLDGKDRRTGYRLVQDAPASEETR